MKMKVTCILIFVLALAPAYAQFDRDSDNFFDTYIIHGNVGNFGFGWHNPRNSSYDKETYFSLFNIGLKDPSTGFGFLFTPIQAFQWAEDWQTENDIPTPLKPDIEAWSLLNVTLFWDLFNPAIESVSFYAGPFTTINYLFFEDNFTWRRYVVTAGLQLGLRLMINGRFDYNIVSLQFGYRNLDGGGNRVFIGGSIDLVTFVVGCLFLLTSQPDSSEDMRTSR